MVTLISVCIYFLDSSVAMVSFIVVCMLSHSSETDCGEVPVQTGMKYFVTPCTTFGCFVVFECEDQYELFGMGTTGFNNVICNADGAWDFGNQRCVGKFKQR